ncbi:hypothetical protein HPT25_05355 [Bacillus sp. BRMEA1]|uniref:hypothetical protein n=1 Tax=Neobacillus endophyticus TaxID=2738405 RepID=UPI001565A90B|nr:hypothetical protein [Neobacillus endophyticus]NRD76920.1 hypothetical protein [Neobacillus endophyticus]
MKFKSGNIERFEQFSQFASLKEFNNHFEMWLVDFKHQFTKGELVGLKRLARFAAKIPGVSNAKIGTILKAIHEEYRDNGISRSTFKRMILKAKQFEILTIHETERKNGSQTSNLYVFNRCPINEPPKAEKMNQPNKTIIPSETNNPKINKRKETPETSKQDLDHSFVSDRVPTPFVQLAKCFFSQTQVIEEYWKMVQIAAYRNDRENEQEEMLETAMDSFRQMIRKLKLFKVKNPYAYFYGILNRKFERNFYDEFFDGFSASKPPLLQVNVDGELLAIEW